MEEIVEPVTNPILLQLLKEFSKDNSNKLLTKLLICLSNAKLLAPVVITGNISNGVISEGSTISFKSLKYSTGDNYNIAFTDWDELRKWSVEEEKTFVVSYDDLKTIFLTSKDDVSGFVINPMSDNFIINKNALDHFSNLYQQVK
jgi:hypothetical protein